MRHPSSESELMGHDPVGRRVWTGEGGVYVLSGSHIYGLHLLSLRLKSVYSIFNIAYPEPDRRPEDGTGPHEGICPEKKVANAYICTRTARSRAGVASGMRISVYR